MITRRECLIALGAGVFAAPLASLAQRQPPKVARIGFLGPESAALTASRVESLRAGFRELGYVEGRNLAIEFRWADGANERLPPLAKELAELHVDVLITHSVRGSLAARQASATLPIVMASVGDPVAGGVVTNLARPGGNITGSTFFAMELFAKRLELLKEGLPGVRRVGFLVHAENPASEPATAASESAAKALKLELQRFEVRAAQEFERAFAAMAASRMQAVSIQEDATLATNIRALARLAAKHRLPSIAGIELAQAGGLIGYGANLLELFRRAAFFADKILRGAAPGDLPIERPTKFELVVNRGAAKALGATIARSLLVRADRVIE